jgi:hypothetical protein
MNGLVHGLRARRHLVVEALGERAHEVAAQMAAVRDELGAVGPVARHLAETIGCAMLCAGRAERLEGELLAGIAGEAGGIAKALHDDRDARVTLALIERYRRAADSELRRSLELLLRLRHARAAGLLPESEVAEEAEAALDEALAAEPVPSQPEIPKIVPLQSVEATLAPVRAPPAAPSPAQMLRIWRTCTSINEQEGREYWDRRTAEEREAILAASEEEKRAIAEGHDPDALYAAARAGLRR